MCVCACACACVAAAAPLPPQVSKAKVAVEEKPWRRVAVAGAPHDHGFALQGEELRTAYVTVDRAGRVEVTSGLKGLSVAKTTQSGYEGFIKDAYTTLPDTKERMMASTVTATWRYARPPPDFNAAYQAARAGLLEAFFGPPRGGVYSPAVQTTLYDMGKAVIARVAQVRHGNQLGSCRNNNAR